MSAQALVDHIKELIQADTELVSKLSKEWLFYGLPTAFPSIYIDAITDIDDKLQRHTFNVCYVTTDMSIGQLDVAKRVKAAIQDSRCIQAQQMLPRPEPENKRNRWIIPCVFYPKAL